MGSPGYNGQLIYNRNKTLDFNINIKDISQNELYLHYDIPLKSNYITQSYINDIYPINSSYISLFEPTKFKIEYYDDSHSINIPYTFSPDFFPGKKNSHIIVDFPKDINNDNIFYENIKLSSIGFYSNKTISNINIFNTITDIYTLQQENSTIFLNIKNNIVIRLPMPNYSVVYKFIVSDSNINYNITFISDFDIISNIISPNIIINNNILLLNKLIKGNSFTLISNNSNYFLDELFVQTNHITYSQINFPISVNNNIIVKLNNNKFTFNVTKNMLYKDLLYKFDLSYLITNLYNITNTVSDINISDSITFNDYYNLYCILKKNTLTNNTLFTTFIENKFSIKYKVVYNSTNNSILFNNNNTPIIYTNYIHNFDISELPGFYILYNSDLSSSHNDYIFTNKYVNIYNKSPIIYLILNDTILNNDKISFNNIFYNQLIYFYYIPIIINTTNKQFIIKEHEGSNTHTITIDISNMDFNTYSFYIESSQLKTNLITILNKSLKTHTRGANFTFSIQNNTVILTHTTNNFTIVKDALFNTLGFTILNSINKQLSGKINYVKGIFKTDQYYNYYGFKIPVDYYTLSNSNINNTISVNLINHKHINLPIITKNNSYTIIINESTINKYLYIYSKNTIYHENQKGNLIVLKPNIDTKLQIGSFIKLIVNNNKYIIIDSKNIHNVILHNLTIYDHPSNFCNLYNTYNSLTFIDKYISIFDIHLIGLKDTKNNIINEKKFLHIGKTLAKLLDFKETKKPYDINIINTLVNDNSIIVLYNNTIPSNLFSNKHLNILYIDYSKINITYNFNNPISTSNLYDYTLEKLMEFISLSYIKTYPHIFDSTFTLDSLQLYNYIQYGSISNAEIEIEDLRSSKTLLNIENTFYNSSKIINTNNTNGIGLNIRINSFKTTYNILVHTILENNIEIVNIGNGYKNNDKIKIELLTNVYIIITLKTSITPYNIKNSHLEVYNKTLHSTTMNELFNNISDDINTNQYGPITIDNVNTFINTSILSGSILYNTNITTVNDSQIYITTLLLGLLGYYNKRFIIDDSSTNLSNSILITPTLIQKYNKSFVNLYLSSTLSNITSLTNIHNYNLTYINYIRSSNSLLSNIILLISKDSKLEFNNITTTYNNIIFDNTPILTVTPFSQFSSILVSSYSIKDNIKTPISIYNHNSTDKWIDISSITHSNSTNTNLQIMIDVTSENTTDKTSYIINASRNVTKTTNTSIYSIVSKYTVFSDILIHNTYTSFDNTLLNNFEYNNNNSSSNLREFTIDIILENIYSTYNITFSNHIEATVVSGNTFVKSYLIKTYYDIVNANIVVTPEDISSTQEDISSTIKTYQLCFKRKLHNIAVLKNINFISLPGISNFKKDQYFYNGSIKRTQYIPFSIIVEKLNTFSTYNIHIEYYHNIQKKYIFLNTSGHSIFNYNYITELYKGNSISTDPVPENPSHIWSVIKNLRIKVCSISEDKSKKTEYIYFIDVTN